MSPQSTGSVRVLRCLDGILYSGVAFAVIAAGDGIGRDTLGDPTLVFILPLLAVAWFVFALPESFPSDSDWASRRSILRVMALGLAVLSPFIVMWGRQQGDIFILANAFVACLFGVGVCYHLTLLMLAMSRDLDAPGLSRLVAVCKEMVFYVVLVSFLAIPLILLIACVQQKGIHMDFAVRVIYDVWLTHEFTPLRVIVALVQATMLMFLLLLAWVRRAFAAEIQVA